MYIHAMEKPHVEIEKELPRPIAKFSYILTNSMGIPTYSVNFRFYLPVEQVSPVNPDGHWHTPSTQVPPFSHGMEHTRFSAM